LTRKENTFINERLFWDLEDEQTENEIFLNLTVILLDLFNEIYPKQLESLLYNELMGIDSCFYGLVIV
jgi:hypothetical protein